MTEQTTGQTTDQTAQRDEILQEREKQWGSAIGTHQRIAEVWSGILDHPVAAHEVALCMVGMKLVRAQINPYEQDSMVDARGYAAIAQEIAVFEKEQFEKGVVR